uniref:Fucosyltransferase N-terminal domain-containing protein n=1 Tax=Panagrellus redivivus TaxID=6233 RepID=A0A7E4W6T0_PANRE
MVRTRSSYIRPRSYTLLRKCCTRRAQACYLFANVVLFLILVGLGIGLTFILDKQFKILKAADEREAKIAKFENTTFMPYCEYFVSPWFLNLCNIQDIYIARAWRVYRLFPGQHHTCMNVQEETKCSESDVQLLPDDGSHKMIQFCPAYNDFYQDGQVFENLESFFKRQTYPRRPLLNLVGNVVRAVDMIAVCPICHMHASDKLTKPNTYPTRLETIRFGWPVTRSKCDIDYEGRRPLQNITTTTEKYNTMGFQSYLDFWTLNGKMNLLQHLFNHRESESSLNFTRLDRKEL